MCFYEYLLLSPMNSLLSNHILKSGYEYFLFLHTFLWLADLVNKIIFHPSGFLFSLFTFIINRKLIFVNIFCYPLWIHYFQTRLHNLVMQIFRSNMKYHNCWFSNIIYHPNRYLILPSSAQLKLKLQFILAEFALFQLSPSTLLKASSYMIS